MKTSSRLIQALCLLSFSATLQGCPKAPPPPLDGAPVSTPAGWQNTVRSVLSTLQWSLPAARLVVSQWDTPAAQSILRALDVAETTSLPGLQRALTTYERAGGDTCAVRAATLGVADSLQTVANTLAQAGWGMAEPLGEVLGILHGVLDGALPACGEVGRAVSAIRVLDAGALRPFPRLQRPDAGR